MYEYGIYNKTTNEQDIIFGYDWKDAIRRSKINPAEWKITYTEYVD